MLPQVFLTVHDTLAAQLDAGVAERVQLGNPTAGTGKLAAAMGAHVTLVSDDTTHGHDQVPAVSA